MDNTKTPQYFIERIIEDIEFSIKKVKDVTLEEFLEDELMNNTICFKFVQISENAKRIPKSIIDENPNIPWNKIFSLRNKIVHDYATVLLDVVYYTVVNDLPSLLENMKSLI